ncbi:alkaline phosphatase D family protein [Cyclobacterium sp.]|uniref:alkaline phosphatase D family protein n=1 Tax=Cyclobacterium sp. TaxID=1966343 RepID=UPI0019A8D7F5|nr:alkaline phosphatase D family protein [Cyclobacterium sp.]MBD3629619.1 alkaline phosphatase D family protein [Cyclobacterium sp.]
MKKNNRRSFFGKVVAMFFTFFMGKTKPLEAKEFHSYQSKGTSSFIPKIYFTNGLKVTEVSQNEAIIWTRLCAQAKPNPIIHPKEKHKSQNNEYPIDFNEQMPVKEMDGGVTGSPGWVRAIVENQRDKQVSEWQQASGERDFTVSFPFTGLEPDTEYKVRLEGKAEKGKVTAHQSGTFKTAGDVVRPSELLLTTSTCQYFWNYDDKDRGFKTYDAMRQLKPDFFIHTGDYVYYDRIGPMVDNLEKARHKWHAMDGWPSLKEFYQHVPIYLLKDDHDLLKDDVFPDSTPLGEFTLEQGLQVWGENVPLKDKPYRTFRWGKDLQVWLVEGREFRTPKNNPSGSPRTIWGEAQKQWFMDTMKTSDATFKILFSPTPVVGPDREKKMDNHANALFQEEGNWLRQFLSDFSGVFVVNGDRHWQYFSIDPETGLREFGAGPVSDAQSGGWSQEDKRPEHQFLRVKGGFLSIKVFRQNDILKIEFRHYDVNGNEMHQEEFEA